MVKTEIVEPGTDWEVVSRYGAVRSAVVANSINGNPETDTPKYDFAQGVHIIAWGRDSKTEQIKIAVLSQARPYADNAFEPENREAMIFEQIPMGFKDIVIEKEKEKFETTKETAIRETTEETGAFEILGITYPNYPKQYVGPGFVGTASDLVFVEVNLEKIDQTKVDKTESIFKTNFIPVSDLLSDIKKGKTDRGYARMCTANSGILIFLAELEEFQHVERNHSLVSKRIAISRDVKYFLSDEERKEYFKLKTKLKALERKTGNITS
jgi:hypothetical protein